MQPLTADDLSQPASLIQSATWHENKNSDENAGQGIDNAYSAHYSTGRQVSCLAPCHTGLSEREEGAVKAEEANRHLEYLGYESHALGRSTRPGLLSTRRFPVMLAVLCALILVGMAVYAACPRLSSVVLAQTGQDVSEDVVVAPSPVDTDDSFGTIQANGGPADWNYSGQHFSYECVGPWYPILVGLLACPGQ